LGVRFIPQFEGCSNLALLAAELEERVRQMSRLCVLSRDTRAQSSTADKSFSTARFDLRGRSWQIKLIRPSVCATEVRNVNHSTRVLTL
jgi:hypothetical protein